MSASDDLQRFVDEAAIRRVIYRYCRGVDRVDRELVRSCYHPDARDSHGTFEGSVEEFLEWCFGLLENYEKTVHFIGNVLVDFDDSDPDVAYAESYTVASHRSSSLKPMRNMTVTCRYVDRFERRPVDGSEPRWRIADRQVVTDLLELGARDRWVEITGSVPAGQRDGSDLVYRREPGRRSGA